MPIERIITDGLWRCLCPNVDLASLSRSLSLLQAPQRRPIAIRQNYSNAQQLGRRKLRRIAVKDHNEFEEVEKSRISYLKRVAKRSPWIPKALFEGVDPLSPKLDRIPTRTIYAALQELQNVEDTYFPVVKLVEYLIRERAEQPNAILYESLIRANADKNQGSARVAKNLLDEMRILKIPSTPQIFQALLEVTAVHPDYTLRSSALFEMNNRWLTLSPNDHINITIGLLRDEQYEAAFAQLEEMNKTPSIIPSWLLDVFLYIFSHLGFHQETLDILKHRVRVADLSKEPVSLNVWQNVLDAFSRDAFHLGIKYIWDRSVDPGYLSPSDGIVTGILNTAARHGDAELAISAIQALSSRGKKLEFHHYEALMQVHAEHSDLRKAFIILCIMAKAGLAPDLSTTRAIYGVLRHSSSATGDALEILNELRVQYVVPAAAFNVVLEATYLHQGILAALDLYRSVRQICAHGPDIETYELLLRNVTMRKSMNFILAEMQAFSIKPTRAIYDHFIRISAMQENYESAFHYLELMVAQGPPGLPDSPWMSRDTALSLIRRCIQAEDVRVGGIIHVCKTRGMNINSEVQILIESLHRQKQYQNMADPELEGDVQESISPALQEAAQPRVLESMSA